MKAGSCAVLLALAIATLFGRSVSSATLKSIAGKDGRIILQLVGEIDEGDTEAFRAAIKSANDAGKLVANVRLNSSGGNLLEGVKLAAAVKFAKMSTNVGHGATCASACFLVFAAGDSKFANYSAQIGVHGASDQTGAETVQSGAATVSMARVAKELGVPSAIIGRMVVTPPSEMVWLSPTDLQSMGTTMVGKPAQVPALGTYSPSPPQQTVPGEPQDLLPKAKASALPTWNEMVDRAKATSASQNGGTPKYFRVCQPETKTCTTGIAYKSKDGTDAIVKVTKDVKENVVSRESCTFNVANDIRLCVDWDKVTMHRDMQNSKGEWYKVSDD
jgi:hypothetical protein